MEDADKTFKILGRESAQRSKKQRSRWSRLPRINLRLGTGGALVASASSINAMNVVAWLCLPRFSLRLLSQAADMSMPFRIQVIHWMAAWHLQRNSKGTPRGHTDPVHSKEYRLEPRNLSGCTAPLLRSLFPKRAGKRMAAGNITEL